MLVTSHQEPRQPLLLGPLLRAARIARGYSLEYVAEKMKTSAAQLSRLENEGRGYDKNGKPLGRRVSTPWLDRYLPVLGLTLPELLLYSAENKNSVPIIGFVAEADTVQLGDGELGRVAPPPGIEGSLQAIEVRTDALWPRYQPGDLIFFRPTSMLEEDAIGHDCVVQTKNHGLRVRKLLRGSQPGIYRLASYRADDIDGVEVIWAARVVSIKLAQ